jgi:hypothetical protein
VDIRDKLWDAIRKWSNNYQFQETDMALIEKPNHYLHPHGDKVS